MSLAGRRAEPHRLLVWFIMDFYPLCFAKRRFRSSRIAKMLRVFPILLAIPLFAFPSLSLSQVTVLGEFLPFQRNRGLLEIRIRGLGGGSGGNRE